MGRSVESGVVFLARLLLSILFIWGGTQKLTGYAGFEAYLGSIGVPFVQVVAPLAVALETVGALLLLVGYRVKPLALVLAAYTVLAALLGHNFWDLADAAAQRDAVIHFWKNLGIAGGFLLLWVTGAGAISIDALRKPASTFPLPRA